MWNVKTKVTPVIIGATDTISHPLENTSAVHQESTISRKYNMPHEYEARNSWDTLYPRNMVCFRYISVNTLRKGDDDDDNGTSVAIASL
jgi:hypothetical protein